jgi:two-component system, sensor histidine kinase and response regulator
MMAARILIVDDDPVLLDALSEALELRMDGVQVATCQSALMALDQIADTDYDAIVADIKMPGMDGLELLSKIRGMRPETPTILITGHGEHDLAVQALRGGAHDYVQKPIDRDYFIASLSEAIDCRRLRRKVEQQRLALEHHSRELENCVQARTNELRQFFHREEKARFEVDDANRRLAEANKQREQLISMIAHDFGQPLTIVGGYAELLMRSNVSSEVRERACNVILSETGRMSRLIDDLAATARLAIGKFRLHLARWDLTEIVQDQVEVIQVLSTQHTIRLLAAPDALPIVCDRDRVTQVLANLLTNAIKYSDGGEIDVRLWVEGQQAWFSVSDEGPGMPEDRQALIFEPYFRQHSDKDDPDSGANNVGLGLHIVKGIVEAHGGLISVESAVDRGTTFTVCLPLNPRSDS